MRVYSATLGTETNTFSPIPTGLQLFEDTMRLAPGRHPARPTPFTAPLWASRERAQRGELELIEGPCSFASPGGITTAQAWAFLRDELLAHLAANLPVDIVALGLHGAMVADGCDDCEGELLARVRALVGPEVVVAAELDPHCHLTELKRASADLLIAFKEYPHTDTLERGRELIDLALRTARREIRPVMAVHDTGMIATLHTTRAPMRGFVDRLHALEGRDGILSVSVVHGFGWGDTADTATRVLVVADADASQAAMLARRLAHELWDLREALRPPLLDADEALARVRTALGAGAEACEGVGGGATRPFVLADYADNPGAGSPGDATFLLARVLAHGIDDVAFGPLVDPMAVRLCFEAGEGARMALRVGGKTGPTSGAPLDLEVQVLHLTREGQQHWNGSPMRLGAVAAVRVLGQPGRRVDLVLVSHRDQAFGLDLFENHGVALAGRRLVVVKSSQHFHQAFGPIAEAVLYVDTPGANAADPARFVWKKISRPRWPMDEGPGPV